MRPRLTPKLVRFGCALPTSFLLIGDIKARMHNGSDSHVRWQELVNLGIADLHGRHSRVMLKRGSKWGEFYDMYGYKDPENGCAFMEPEIEIRKIFRPNNVYTLPRR